MSLVDAINAATEAAARVALTAFPDRCSLITITSVPDGFGGSTETETTVESNIPCIRDLLTKGMQPIAGSQITTQTDRIMMKDTENTRLIQSHYKIVIAARVLPQLTFENPVTLDGSYAPIVTIAAARVVSG
jgi:hypothetical protein